MMLCKVCESTPATLSDGCCARCRHLLRQAERRADGAAVPVVLAGALWPEADPDPPVMAGGSEDAPGAECPYCPGERMQRVQDKLHCPQCAWSTRTDESADAYARELARCQQQRACLHPRACTQLGQCVRAEWARGCAQAAAEPMPF